MLHRMLHLAVFFGVLAPTAQASTTLSGTTYELNYGDCGTWHRPDIVLQQGMRTRVLARMLVATVGTDGQVNWTPTEQQGPSTNMVLVRVSDSGVPALSTTNA
jgi:hypothetical protein